MAEALRFGVPVISTRTSGSLDFIKNGKNGFLVNNDEKEIAKKLEYILKLNRSEYIKIKKNSKISSRELKPEIAIKKVKSKIEDLLE
jgi:glycosyltransferase involved in cell wall biosynthesis